MNEANKLALIRVGDVIGYRDASGKTCYSIVAGWQDRIIRGQVRKCVLLEDNTHVPLPAVISRERHAGSCGAGTIVFEEQVEQTV